MKKISLSLFYLLTFSLAYSQHIHYQKTFSAALTQAAKNKKLVLVILSIPSTPNNPALKTAITHPEIAKEYQQNFICYTVDYTDSAAIPLIKKYKTTVYPSYLFMDTLGNLVYKESTGSTSTTKYFLMKDKALAAQTSGRTLSNYIARYNHNKYINKNDTAFLKNYITLREGLGYTDNADLIDEYANQLSLKDFQDYQTILFIMKAGPYAFGKTYGLCFVNKNIMDSIHKKEAPAVRSLINQRIIANTTNNAIAYKNPEMAKQCAGFITALWSASPQKAAIITGGQLLDYYRGINDTASYFKQATVFFNNYYMNISADSAAKTDKEISKTFYTKFMYSMDPGDRIIDNSAQANAAVLHPVSRILNMGAYSFYTLGTRNQTYLTTALLWSKRAIELYPSYYNYDTLAHLLYRSGLFAESLSTQNKAVELAIKNKTLPNEIKQLEAEQHKIKNHLL